MSAPDGELNVDRLLKYAARVANESTVAKRPAILGSREVDVSVRREKRSGFLGLGRTSYRTVEKQSRQVELVAAHWLLFETRHRIDDRTKGRELEFTEHNSWVLTEAGKLLYIWDWEEFRYGRLDRGYDVKEMSAERMRELDYAHPHYDKREGGASYIGNRQKGKLVRHSPGVGLSLAMKSLLPAQ